MSHTGETSSGALDSVIKEAAVMIEQADAIIILAGAGMSVDSGLPDYRGDEGLWKEHPFIKEQGLSFVEMASPQLFENDPALAWRFYGERQQMCRDTKPHRCYEFLSK